MSTIKVENLTGITSGSNANKVIVPAGQELIAPGHLLQSVHNTSLPTAYESIDSSSFAATNVHVSITPKLSTSTMVVTCVAHVDLTGGTNCTLAIFKDGSIITPKSPSASYDGHSYINRLTNGRILLMQSILATDSTVGTTSAVTYKLYVKTHSGNILLRHDLTTCRILVQEIAA